MYRTSDGGPVFWGKGKGHGVPRFDTSVEDWRSERAVSGSVSQLPHTLRNTQNGWTVEGNDRTIMYWCTILCIDVCSDHLDCGENREEVDVVHSEYFADCLSTILEDITSTSGMWYAGTQSWSCTVWMHIHGFYFFVEKSSVPAGRVLSVSKIESMSWGSWQVSSSSSKSPLLLSSSSSLDSLKKSKFSSHFE